MASNNVAIVALVIVLVAIFYFSQNPPDADTTSPADFVVNLFDNNEQGGIPPASQPEVIDGRTNICRAYVDNYPVYFEQKRLECGLAGGDWTCETDQAGCFDIATWDHVYGCSSSAPVQFLKAMCATMGGDWTCNSVQVGCQYA